MRFPTMWHFDKCRLRRVFHPPFKLRNSKCCSVSSINSHRIFKSLAKALVRLCVCAGWSEPLLVAHTTLLEISCRGTIMILVRMMFASIEGSDETAQIARAFKESRSVDNG